MKTSELSGAALDWAVTKCEGNTNGWCGMVISRPMSYIFRPSTNWAQGGLIIERELIDICTSTRGGWIATLITDWEDGTFVQGEGDTCLIAAMRCYVASKLGDTIDIPNELTGETA